MTKTKLLLLEQPANAMVPTHAYKTIVGALRTALLFGSDGMTVITGMPGIGKTSTINEFAAGRSNVAVVMLSRLTGGAQTGLVRICNVLGEKVHLKGVNLEDTLKRRLQMLRLTNEDHRSLLIIDEAQHASIDLLDELRYFWEMVGLGLVLVGNDHLRTTVDDLRDKHPQISDRITADISLEKKADDINLFCRRHDLSGEATDLVRQLWSLGGAFRTVKNILLMAAHLRGDQGARLERQHVEEAAKMMGVLRD